MRVREGVPSLRNPALFAEVRKALRAGRNRFGFRVNHFSVQSNHLHLIVEASGREALSRGMQGLGVRIAKTINARLRRAGTVFADRYHDRILKSLREVRNALVYVLKNARHHGITHADGRDLCSSAEWFDGWRNGTSSRIRVPETAPPVEPARTWMLSTGWKRFGLIPVQVRPPKPGG
jgi:REP element-mobilizing transposase RayT